MSFASLRRVLRSARKGLCSTCSKTKYPQLVAAGAGHVGCLIYTFETLGQLIRDENDVTAMHVAARKGQISVLIYIVEKDLADGVPRARNGATPAHDSAGTGNLECLRYLIGHTKASVSDLDNNSATPLHWAVQSGHMKAVQWLVVEGKSQIDVVARNGVTVFHIAAAKNFLDILRWLVAHAYRHYNNPRKLVNIRDKNGATPIYHAAHAGHVGITQWLAEKGGGDPTIVSNQGLAPLHAATIAGHQATVQYLFKFGIATAPGGLRTNEGACALHFAAADGHVDIMKWLLSQAQCSGNERDFYRSTPIHDAAEHGRLKILQLLCEMGADITLSDIEGNTPKDLAEKNGQNKCVKFLSAALKQRASSHGTHIPAGRQPRHGKSDAVGDSFRKGPSQPPSASVYEEEEDFPQEGSEQWETLHDLMDKQEIERLQLDTQPLTAADEKRKRFEENLRREREQHERKRQIMMKREKEYEQKIRDQLIAEEGGDVSSVVRKEWDLTQKNRMINPSPAALKHVGKKQRSFRSDSEQGLVQRRAKEYESREPPKGLFVEPPPGRRGSVDEPPTNDATEESLPEPPPIPTIEYLLGKRPVNLRKRVSAAVREQRAETDATIGTDPSESDYDSDHSSVSSVHSSVGSAHSSVGSTPGSVSSAQSEAGVTPHRKKSKKKKKKKDEVMGDEGGDWTYNKLSAVPQSSPPREKKRTLTPYPGLISKTHYVDERFPMPVPRRLEFDEILDEVSKDLETAAISPPSSSLSPPLKSPISPASQTSPPTASVTSTSPLSSNGGPKVVPSAVKPPGGSQEDNSNVAAKSPKRRFFPKRAAPKTPPHKQNKKAQEMQQQRELLREKQQQQQQVQPKPLAKKPPQDASDLNHLSQQEALSQLQPTRPARAAPIAKKMSSRAKGASASAAVPRVGPASEVGSVSANTATATKNPTAFMTALNKAIDASPKRPQVVRQVGRNDSTEEKSPPSSPTMDEIELQLDAMRSTLAGGKPQQQLPSPEFHRRPKAEAAESESESSEDSSGSDDTSSSTDSSSDDSSDEGELVAPKRPVMARNIGMIDPRMIKIGPAGATSGGGDKGNGLNRIRLMSRYPRLFRRRIIRLPTIIERAEEQIHQAKTLEAQADIFFRLMMEKKYMAAWRKYMQFMKSAYRRARKMAQRRRRDLMARMFYSWIQVRNIGAVEVYNMEKARIHYIHMQMRRVFYAWRHVQPPMLSHTRRMSASAVTSMHHVTSEQRYLAWVNRSLAPLGHHVEDIEDSLADGILMIKALEVVSGEKAPKYNPHPKVRLHRQDNWKTAHEFMKRLGINVRGIEPADLGNTIPAALHNMFNNVLKWYEQQDHSATSM